MLSSFSSKTMTNNDAVNTAEAQLKELLSRVKNNKAAIEQKIKKDIAVHFEKQVKASIAEIKAAKTKEQKEQIEKIASTTESLILNFNKIISGDPVTSVTGVLGVIGGVAGLASGPAGVAVGAVCSVITTILSLFGVGGANESALQEKMIRELLEQFKDEELSVELEKSLNKIKAHISTIEGIFETYQNNPDKIKAELSNHLISNEVDIINLGRDFISELGSRIKERLSTSDDKVALRVNKYLFYCTMVYARKQFLLGYMANIAQEYEVSESGRFTIAMNTDNKLIKDTAKFIRNPMKSGNQRLVYKYFFLQSKNNREAFFAMQENVIEDDKERMLQQEIFTFESFAGTFHNLFTYNRVLTLGSITKKDISGSRKRYYWYQAPPARQYWQIFKLDEQDTVAIYNIFEMGFLKIGMYYDASLDTEGNYKQTENNSFVYKKAGWPDNQMTIKTVKEEAPLVVRFLNNDLVRFEKDKDKIEKEADVWVVKPATRKIVILQNLQNQKYITRRENGYCQAWGDKNEATEFEMIECRERRDGKSKLFASLKIPGENLWVSYTEAEGWIRLYDTPEDRYDIVYWQVFKNSDYSSFRLETRGFEQYIGLKTADNPQLFVNKYTKDGKSSRCHFKVEIVEEW